MADIIKPKRGRKFCSEAILARELGITMRALRRLGGADKWRTMTEDAQRVLLNMTKERSA